MTTYTVFDDGDFRVLGRGLAAEDAMAVMLTHDGYRYEIRKSEFQGGICWDLYHSDGSATSTRARHMVKTVAFSLVEGETDATREIAEQVIAAGWTRMPQAMADRDFDAMMADVAGAVADDE